MNRALLLVLVACGSSSSTPTTPVQPVSDAIAIVDATVIPMDREGALAHHTVIVQRGKIAAVGPTATTPTPAGAYVIDGRGKWLIPGLADMHVHTYDPQQLALFVAMGVTSIRVLWGAPAVLGARDAINRGEQRLAPSIVTAGSIIDGIPTVWPGSTGVMTAEAARAAVTEQSEAGYDLIKVYNRLPKEAYDAIVDEAGKRHLPVIGHVVDAVGLDGALAAKQKTIEHLEGYTKAVVRDDSPNKDAKDFKARLALFKDADPKKLDAAIARTKAAGTWNCPTLIVLDRISHFDEFDMTRPEFRFVPKAMLASWNPKLDFRFRSWEADDFKLAREGNAWRRALVKKLVDAGAGVVAGTDVGNPGLVPGFSLHQELELFVEAKLTPAQALRAATTAPAELLGKQTEQGAIAVGMRADLVLLDADPLADIRNTQKIDGVVLRGRWLPRKELAGMLEHVAAIYDGKASRFTEPQAKTGTVAAYRGTGRDSGEQRITMTGQSIVSEVRGDWTAPATWRIEAGADGRGARVMYTQDGLDLTLSRDRDQLRVSGKHGRRNIERTFPLAADETLGGAPLAMDVLAYRQLRDVAVGAKRELKLAVIDPYPLAIQRMTLEATRLPDKGAVRRFEVRAANVSFEIGIDAEGFPVEHPDHERLP